MQIYCFCAKLNRRGGILKRDNLSRFCKIFLTIGRLHFQLSDFCGQLTSFFLNFANMQIFGHKKSVCITFYSRKLPIDRN